MAERIVYIPANAPVIAPSLIAEFERQYYGPEQPTADAENSELEEQELTGDNFSSDCEQLPTVPVGHQTEEFPLSFEDLAYFEEPLLPVGESSKQQQNNHQFHLSSREEVEQLSIKQVPPKTQASTKWAISCFNTWLENRNKIAGSEKCPLDLLKTQNDFDLNYWLKIFAIEARKISGEQYPPKTLYLIFSGILRYMRAINSNILSKKYHTFDGLHNTLDRMFRKLRSEGVGAVQKHAEPFNKDEENSLWKSGVMGTHTPQALFNAIFYYNGKGCCLRGGEEHRNLKLSQFRKIDNG